MQPNDVYLIAGKEAPTLRVSRLQFSIWRLMVVVLLVSLVLALTSRQKRLEMLAQYHVDQASANHDPVPLTRGGPPPRYTTSIVGPTGVRTSRRLTTRGVWHLKKSGSYEELAHYNTLLLIATSPALLAYLLHRGGLRPAAVTTVTLGHVIALLCVRTVSIELAFMATATVTLGTCTYAVLAVDRLWLQAAIVLACFIAFGALLAQESVGLCIVLLAALACWTGFMVPIKEWARTHPNSKPALPEAL